MTCHLSFISLATVAIISLGGLPAAPAMAETKLRFAHISAPSSHFGAGAAAFAKELARLTGGRIATEIFPNSTLGGEWEVIEKLQRGEIDMTSTSTGPVGNFVHDAMIFDIPFLFKDRAHAHAVLDGPIGQEILSKFSIYRLVALAWGENGFRHLTNSRHPVTNPADIKGLKLRTMENEIHIQAFSALGAQPVPIAFNELGAALRQGIVDGQENPIPLIVSEKMAQVQQYLTLSGHTYSPALFLVSKMIFDKLPGDDKKALLIAGKAGAKAQRDRVAEIEENGIEELRKQGMKIVTNVDSSAFKAAMKPAYSVYAKKFGQMKLDAIADHTP